MVVNLDQALKIVIGYDAEGASRLRRESTSLSVLILCPWVEQRVISCIVSSRKHPLQTASHHGV